MPSPRSGSAEAEAALSRQGRYQEVAGNLRVREVRIAEDERFVICRNPDGAERDAAVRARLIAQLKELIDGADALGKDKRAELRGAISAKPGLNRYLRVTPGGLLRTKEERIRAHVILCWLALLLARVVESTRGQTWPQLRRQLDRIAVGTFTGPAGTFRQRTEISPAQQDILEQLGIDPPPRIYQLTLAATG